MNLKYMMAPEGDVAVGTAEPAVAPAAGESAQQQQVVTTKGGKVLPMAQTSIDKLKRDAAERGKRAAQAEIEQRMKSLGYGSVDELIKAAERAKKSQHQPKVTQQNGKPKERTSQVQTQQPQNGGTRRADRRERESQERLERERRERIRAQRRAQQAERDTWAAEAHGQLSRLAIKQGIKDEDYAITLLTRELNQKQATMAPADYDKYQREFDEAKYFEGLKKTHPHLFQETVALATTGTTTDDKAAPPPGTVQVTDAQTKGVRKGLPKMTKEEYNAELRRRGLTPPSLS